MQVLEDTLTADYRRLSSQPCVTDHPFWENRNWWRRPAQKREGRLLRHWFIGRGLRPRASDWLRYRQRPANAPQVHEVIESSRWILDLEDDWDQQGSSKYSESTWQRACDFLIQQATLARQVLGKELPAPRILPGPEGSIDVHWKLPRFEVLVNIPNDSSKPATFYGDDYGDLCVRGNLNPSEPIPGLVVWLLS